MKKNYKIRQSQLDELIKVKKDRKTILENILIEIKSAKSHIKNENFQNEVVVDILKKYLNKGELTKPIAKMLIENGVNNEDLLLVGMKFTDIVL